jgi:hypothetical protein
LKLYHYRISAKLDDPGQEFDVTKLVAQIEQECVWPDGFGQAKSSKDTTKWGGESGESSMTDAALPTLADKCRQKTCQNAIAIRHNSFKKANKTSILKNKSVLIT